MSEFKEPKIGYLEQSGEPIHQPAIISPQQSIVDIFDTVMLSQGYGQQVKTSYSYQTSHTTEYNFYAKNSIIAGMDVALTYPIRQLLSGQGYQFDLHNTPVLITTKISFSQQQGRKYIISDHHKRLEQVAQHTRIDDLSPIIKGFETKLYIANHHDIDNNIGVIAHYRMIDSIDTINNSQIITADLKGRDPIGDPIMISQSHLNHYGTGIVHGSYLIKRLLDAATDSKHDLSHGKISFYRPGLQGYIIQIYNKHNEYILTGSNEQTPVHILARLST